MWESSGGGGGDGNVGEDHVLRVRMKLMRVINGI